MQSFFHLILLRHQNTKTRCHKFSKNHWVMALFEIFRSAREKLQFTVALDHPVSILATALPQCQHLDNCSKRWNVSHLTPATLALCLLQHPNVVWGERKWNIALMMTMVPPMPLPSVSFDPVRENWALFCGFTCWASIRPTNSISTDADNRALIGNLKQCGNVGH